MCTLIKRCKELTEGIDDLYRDMELRIAKEGSLYKVEISPKIEKRGEERRRDLC